MAFRNIPKKFDMAEIATELKAALLYSDWTDSSVINDIAAILGCKKRTVYARLSGEIKLSLDFLHAAVIATKGDPDVRKYLEPSGFRLSFCDDAILPDKETVAEECVDDTHALSDFHKKMLDPDSTYAECMRACDLAYLEMRESVVLRFKNKKG